MASNRKNAHRARPVSRRRFLKDAGSVAALGAATTALSPFAQPAMAQTDLRKQILGIPGVDKGSPTDADWQKVGELCLGPTKANVTAGEFKGVELTFMGLNNQNLHNLLFRGFLKPWETYTGAKISWIDLAQADYNPRLQQAIATGTVDFDVLEMGAPFEGDVCGKGLASEMPDWVKKQVDVDDYVDYLKPPVGTWNGKTYRVTIDGDCHNFNYRTDVFADPALAKAWKAAGNTSEWAVPKTWQQVQAVTKFLKGKKIGGKDAWGYLDSPKPWGGFGFYFLGSRATAYAKHPDDKAWLFDVDTMKPRINNPAWVRAIQDVVDALPSEPADQLNADPRPPPSSSSWPARGRCCRGGGRRIDGPHQRHVGHRQDHRFRHPSRLGRRLQRQDGSLGQARERPHYAPNCAYLGWGVYVMARVNGDAKKHKAAWSAAAHLGGKDLSLWTVMYPSGFQVYRTSHSNVDEWLAGFAGRCRARLGAGFVCVYCLHDAKARAGDAGLARRRRSARSRARCAQRVSGARHDQYTRGRHGTRTPRRRRQQGRG